MKKDTIYYFQFIVAGFLTALTLIVIIEAMNGISNKRVPTQFDTSSVKVVPQPKPAPTPTQNRLKLEYLQIEK